MSTQVPTSEEFVTLYPQFSAADVEPLIAAQLSISSRLLLVDAWQDFYSDAVMLDCAHNLVLQQQMALPGGAVQMAAGPLSSGSAAGMSYSFNTPSIEAKTYSRNWYMKTAYGQQFLRLQSAVVPVGKLVL